jgi:DNA-directed RNA polymerase alpha subunit
METNGISTVLLCISAVSLIFSIASMAVSAINYIRHKPENRPGEEAKRQAEPSEKFARLTILDTDIWDTGLSSRIRLALLCHGIKTVEDLVTEITSREEMYKLRGIGDVSVREVEDFLSRNGLSFGMFKN